MFLVHFSLVNVYVMKEIVIILELQSLVVMIVGGMSIQISQFLIYGK